MARTIVYIDGFNFYYGSVKGTPYRWLDLLRFSRALLPKNDVIKVKYFTAIVKPSPKDPGKSTRQLAYLRALGTIPEVEVFLGSFQAHSVKRPLADGSGYAQVIDMKEKGSDVNLATALIVDAFTNTFDVAAVVSNDSDLVAPIRAVISILGKPVGFVNPHPRPSAELQKCCSFLRQVRPWALKTSQLPDVIADAAGEIHKPAGW